MKRANQAELENLYKRLFILAHNIVILVFLINVRLQGANGDPGLPGEAGEPGQTGLPGKPVRTLIYVTRTFMCMHTCTCTCTCTCT